MSLVPLAPFLDFARDDKEGANELRRLTFCAACALRTPSKFYGSSVVGSFEGSCLRWSRSTGHRVRQGRNIWAGRTAARRPAPHGTLSRIGTETALAEALP